MSSGHCMVSWPYCNSDSVSHMANLSWHESTLRDHHLLSYNCMRAASEQTFKSNLTLSQTFPMSLYMYELPLQWNCLLTKLISSWIEKMHPWDWVLPGRSPWLGHMLGHINRCQDNICVLGFGGASALDPLGENKDLMICHLGGGYWGIGNSSSVRWRYCDLPIWNPL